jgi:hypothetical protein
MGILLSVREIHRHHAHDYLMNPSATRGILVRSWSFCGCVPRVDLHFCVSFNVGHVLRMELLWLN